MKFDSLLAQYLYENKKLQLQGIGTFELDRAVNTQHDQDKETYYPIDGLTFTYNTKDVTNEDLITFLVKKLSKIQPLVRSDLDSYLSNIKQFLNIGKPYTIEGVGTLNKNNQGTYEFTPGNFLPVKEELNPKRERNEPSLKGTPEPRNSGRALAIILIVIASLAVLGGIGWGISTFFIKKDQTAELSSVNETEKIVDTTTTATVADTSTNLKPKPDSSSVSDLTSFKMIYEVTNLKTRAVTRTEALRKGGMNTSFDTLTINNLPKYRLYVPMTVRFADTLRIKDSLRKWFGRPIYIQKVK